MEFQPNFNVSWESTPKENSTTFVAQTKQQLGQVYKRQFETFNVENAFANYKPSFPTEISKTEINIPDPVEPINSLTGTTAEQIFSNYCQEKLGFMPKLAKEQ